MNKKEAGRLGGNSTFNKYGRDHMVKIGRNGAYKLHEKYNIVPIGIGEYALVDRITEKIVAKF